MLSGLIREINKLLGIDFGPSSAPVTNLSITEGPPSNSEPNPEEALPLRGNSFQASPQPDWSSAVGPRQGAEKLFGPLPILAYFSLSTSTLNFGNAPINSSRSLSFSVTNNSDKPVSVTLSGLPSGFSISPSSTIIAPYGCWSFSVTFNPTEIRDYSGYINITPGGNSIFVSGKGTKN